MRLIDADELYKKACRLVAQAQNYVGKLIERDGDEPSTEWKVWSAILTERTAFKHDVFDAPSAQPEIIQCCKCGFWDRDTLRHQFNDFRDWNEAECLILAERDAYHEINRYTEADDFCSRAERRTDGVD